MCLVNSYGVFIAMIEKILLLCLMLGASFSVSAKDPDGFYAVQELFDGISTRNHEKISHNVSPDFQLLEVGEVWNLKDLITALKSIDPKITRRSFFKVIDYRVMVNVVTVSYWNKAMMQNGQNTEVKIWLESAVLKKDNEQWRIHLLHSTRLTADNYPKTIEYEEYIGD